MKIEGLLKSVGYLGNGGMSLNPGKCESICNRHNVRAIVSNGVSFEKYGRIGVFLCVYIRIGENTARAALAGLGSVGLNPTANLRGGFITYVANSSELPVLTFYI